jgi:hypothetical protein
VAVILAAVAVGALLMWLGYSNDNVEATGDDTAQVADDGGGDDSSSTDGDETGGDDGATTTTDTTSTTTTTTTAPAPTARPPAEVNVLVLNAAVGKPGIAGRGAKIVEQAGYATLDPDNANNDQETEVQYAPGYEADAVGVAQAFGLDESVVVPFPDTLNVDEPGDAHVIAIIGLDGKIDI